MSTRASASGRRKTKRADEIIVVGGHLDSWDLGDGAHDDGAGIVRKKSEALAEAKRARASKAKEV